MRVFFSCLMIALTANIAHQGDDISISQVDDGLWLSENADSCITAQMLSDLNQLIADEMTDCMEVSAQRPIVVDVVSAGSTERYPDGTEGYAGMASFAEWDCEPGEDAMHQSCQFSAADPTEPPDDAILLLLVTEQETAGAMLGYLAHELSHAHGSVDGERCPYHPDYDADTELEADYCDAYWWYGVEAVDMFNYRPTGLIQMAVEAECAESDDPALCHRIEELLEQLPDDACNG